MHDALTFTMERENNGQLPFMNVAITRTNTPAVSTENLLFLVYTPGGTLSATQGTP